MKHYIFWTQDLIGDETQVRKGVLRISERAWPQCTAVNMVWEFSPTYTN